MYHLSKVHDSHNILFACRTWGLRATDLNQGVVYNIATEETERDEALANRFDYDEVFGTALNRFCAEAAAGHPLTVYGAGGQTRGFLDLRDTVRCIELAALHPASGGRDARLQPIHRAVLRAGAGRACAARRRGDGACAAITTWTNPRIEREEHYYLAKHTRLLDLGLEPHLLTDETIAAMLAVALRYREHIDLARVRPTVRWR